MGFFSLYGVKSATDKADVALGIRLYVYAGSNLHVVVHATRKRWVITSTRNTGSWVVWVAVPVGVWPVWMHCYWGSDRRLHNFAGHLTLYPTWDFRMARSLAVARTRPAAAPTEWCRSPKSRSDVVRSDVVQKATGGHQPASSGKPFRLAALALDGRARVALTVRWHLRDGSHCGSGLASVVRSRRSVALSGNAPLIVLGLQGAEDLASACGAPDKLQIPHSRGSFPKLSALSMWIACGSKLMPAE